jgi:biotin synthase-related radical SAM superfamily protein
MNHRLKKKMHEAYRNQSFTFLVKYSNHNLMLTEFISKGQEIEEQICR